MEHSKLYQYEDVAKASALDYSGKLAVKTTGDNQYDVSSPVNTAENYSVNEDVIVLSNTLDNEELMKFSFSFKVNRAAIGVGTQYLIEMPGLVKVKSEDNKLWFYFPWESMPRWKYLNATELVDGWNTILLTCDGVKMKLLANGTEHILIDTTLSKNQVGYIGGQNKYILLDNTAPISTADSWEINTVLQWKDSGSASYPAIFAYSGGIDYQTPVLLKEGGSIKMYLSSGGGGWDINTENTGWVPEAGKTYAVAAGFTGTEYYVKWKEYGALEWAGQWTKASTTKAYCTVPFWFLNASLNTYNYYNASMLWLTETNIIINGEKWFDGRQAVETETGFANNGCGTYHFTEGPEIPKIMTGKLKVYQSWLSIKDIEALKIENEVA